MKCEKCNVEMKKLWKLKLEPLYMHLMTAKVYSIIYFQCPKCGGFTEPRLMKKSEASPELFEAIPNVVLDMEK